MLTLLADLTPASAVCLGVSAAGVVALPALLFADATRADFDPRPLLARAIESEAFYPLLREWDNAKHDARHALAHRLAAAASRLTSPKGATR